MRATWPVLAMAIAGCAASDVQEGSGMPCEGVYRDMDQCTECPWIDGCPIPEADADPEVVLLVDATYPQGGRAVVRARNTGLEPYVYSDSYEACRMHFFTETGRQFIVPPGTHCDIPSQKTIAPGQTVDLFTWDLDECIRDRWGCAEKEPLPPGFYELRDTFCRQGAGWSPPPHGGGSPPSDCEAGMSRPGAAFRIA